MTFYTDEEVSKLIEISHIVYRKQERDVQTIYSVGREVIGFVPGRTEKSDKAYVIAKISDTIDLSFSKPELIGFFKFPEYLDNFLEELKKNCMPAAYLKLEDIKEFLFKVPFNEIPLWVNKLPILVKWRLEIGR